MKLKIGMLFPIRYGPNMRVNPQIGIASYLVNFGHEITWILSAENSRTTQQVTLNRIDVYAAPYIHYLSETPILGKGLNQAIADFKKMLLTFKVFRDKKYDLIFVRNNTIDGLVGTYIKKRYRIPLVYELSVPLEIEAEGYKIEGRKPLFLWYTMAKVKAWLKIYTMRKADLILTTTRWFEEGLAEKGISSSKLMPSPSGVDIESFAAKEGKDIREQYHLGDSKVLIYLGVMAKMRKLELLIQAFLKVKEERKNVKLLMVGVGTGKEDLERLAAELGVRDDVIFTGQVPQAEVPDFIAAADIGVSPVPPFPFYKVSSPIKVLEYMAMAKPVVANEEIFGHKEALDESGGGILVPFTPEAIASAIIELLDNADKAQEMGRRGRGWVVKNRSFEILAHRLEERYLKVIMDNQEKARQL